MTHNFARWLGKEAAKRVTSRTKSVKVFATGGRGKVQQALQDNPDDARQLPWSYGEKRQQSNDATP